MKLQQASDIRGPFDIDCVIVEVEGSSTLRASIQSVLNAEYNKGAVRIFYVSRGYSEEGAQIAARFDEVEVLTLHTAYPTPGAQRNLGWRSGDAPFVQLLDADTTLVPDFWTRAMAQFRQGVAAVRGRREERYPEASAYNWIADVEWNPPPGKCDAFGHDVLIRRSSLETTGGYDEELVGGEEVELSHRVVQEGYTILHLDASMTRHDLVMDSPIPYWRAAYRNGYGFAAVTFRHRKHEKRYWIAELDRIALRGGAAIALIVLALLWTLWTLLGLVLLIPALALLLAQKLMGRQRFAKSHYLSQSRSAVYAWHCAFVVVPQFFGIIRFFIAKIFRWPLRNKRASSSYTR